MKLKENNINQNLYNIYGDAPTTQDISYSKFLLKRDKTCEKILWIRLFPVIQPRSNIIIDTFQKFISKHGLEKQLQKFI